MFSDLAQPEISQKPFVSVVIPAYNQAGFICICLASLLSQTYPLDRYEIILVDDGSTDDTANSAKQLLQGWRGRYHLVQKENGGPASARNAGIQASEGEVIAFMDADCVAAKDWLEWLAGALVAGDAAGVGGPLVNVDPMTWVSHYLASTAFFRHRVRHGRVDYLLTANVVFRRSALLHVHGFIESGGAWGEDADLSFRLIQAGYKLLLVEQGVVTHYGTPTSLRGLIKDLYRYGYGNFIRSRSWQNGRTPGIELMRHTGAVILSPVIAFSYLRRVGVWWILAFWPLIVIEHGAFIAGLLSGMLRGVSGRTICQTPSS